MAKENSYVEIATEGLSRAQVLAVILHTASQLNWSVQHLHPMRVVLHVPNKGLSGIAEVEIIPSQDTIKISSSSVGWTPFARKDRHTVIPQLFIQSFSTARTTIEPEQLAEEVKELEENGIMQKDESTINGDRLRLKDMAGLFIPKEGFFVSAILIDLNILIFLIMSISGVSAFMPEVEDVFNWGGNFRPATLGGDWWRLLTACFIHFGILHLVMNIYAFAMVAVQLEPILGRLRMLALYLMTGVFASAASLWWNDNTVSAGASGAVFGMYGVYLALLTTDLIHKEVRKPLLSSIGIFVGYNLLYGMKGGIDNAAHIGGLLSGVLFGFFSYLAFKRPQLPAIRMVSVMVPTFLLAIASVVAIAPMMNDDGTYEAQLEAFFDNQQQGMVFFEMVEAGISREELIQEITDRSLPAWYANRALLYSMEDMDLSSSMRERHHELVRYCDLRIQHYDLIRMQLTIDHDRITEEKLAQVEHDLNEILLSMNGEADEAGGPDQE